MPKVVISSDKGLVQKAGTTVIKQITSRDALDGTFGLYTYVREIDFAKGGASGGAYTSTATDEGLVARICQLANPSVILEASIQISEEFAGGFASHGDVTLAMAADTNVTSGAAVGSATDITTSVDIKGAAGSAIAIGQAAGGVAVTSKDEIAIINDDGAGANTAALCTAGKLLVTLKVLSSAAPVDLAQKF